MKTMSLTALALLGCLAAGCGGVPKPPIEGVNPRPDSINVRMMIGATNYDEAWDNEKVRVICSQIWLNEDDVPERKELVFDKPFNGRQGESRAVVVLKELDGTPSNYVMLQFELKSGENPTQENVSASATLEWYVPSSMENRDILMVAVINRKSRNNYAFDRLYALEPDQGDIEQILPSYNAK